MEGAPDQPRAAWLQAVIDKDDVVVKQSRLRGSDAAATPIGPRELGRAGIVLVLGCGGRTGPMSGQNRCYYKSDRIVVARELPRLQHDLGRHAVSPDSK